jgi:acyl dehydratase
MSTSEAPSPSASEAALGPGAKATWSHVVTADDIAGFVAVSGDDNPIHLDDEFARARGYRGRIAHGMLMGAFVSRVLGTMLPGSAGVSMSQDLHFAKPVYVGDRIDVEVEVTHHAEALGAVVLKTTITNDRGETVVRGQAKSRIPAVQASA